jgi:aminoacyl-tRNA hydrolase
MSPVTTPDGVTFIRDDCKAPLWSVASSLEFMRNANAKRKIVVMGTISDYHGNPAQKYPRVARQALEVADVVCFVGEQASMALRARRHSGDNALRAFANTDQLLEFLHGFVRHGGLVLLKGSEKAENLQQVVHSWSSQSQRISLRSAGLQETPQNRLSTHVGTTSGAFDECAAIIIGLGNPGNQYHGTPHNVGAQTLDFLADSLDARWSQEEAMLVASVSYAGSRCLLVKPQCAMNDTGPALLRMSGSFRFACEDCIVIHDDIHLALGTIRQRLNGSAGGHLGMQSLIIAFQSEGFRRIKIGVGRPNSMNSLQRYVLTRFTAAQLEAIDKACQIAAGRVLETVKGGLGKHCGTVLH